MNQEDGTMTKNDVKINQTTKESVTTMKKEERTIQVEHAYYEKEKENLLTTQGIVVKDAIKTMEGEQAKQWDPGRHNMTPEALADGGHHEEKGHHQVKDPSKDIKHQPPDQQHHTVEDMSKDRKHKPPDLHYVDDVSEQRIENQVVGGVSIKHYSRRQDRRTDRVTSEEKIDPINLLVNAAT